MDPLRVACVAVVVAVRCRRRCRFVVSRDRRRALVHNAWALQPGGGWLRGVVLAPPDCGGGCARWWALVVVARTVGRWAIDTALLCTAPGPLGPVDGGRGGAGGALPLVSRLRTIEVVGGWWRASVGNGAIGVARLCATPGPFDPVDRGGDLVQLVAPDRRRRRRVLWLWPLVGRSPVAPRLRRRALLHNARAFRPGGRWCGGVPLVPSDYRRRCRGARLWPLVGRGLVALRCQRRTLLCDVGSSLVAGS